MSDKPITERLQVKAERRLAVTGAPPALDRLIGAADRRAALHQAEVVLDFAKDRAELASQLAELKQSARPDSILWVAYPKLTSALAGELSREAVRDMAAAAAMDTVAQIALDADWSAMRLKRL